VFDPIPRVLRQPLAAMIIAFRLALFSHAILRL
jgi:hypothetical protein